MLPAGFSEDKARRTGCCQQTARPRQTSPAIRPEIALDGQSTKAMSNKAGIAGIA